jgi:TonB family protein
MNIAVPDGRKFPASLTFSLVVHAVILFWIWLHRPNVLEISLPGNLSVDMVGTEAPAAAPAASAKAAEEAPPQAPPKDEVTTPAAKPRVKPKKLPPPPPKHAPVRPSPMPAAASPASGQTATAEAHLGLAGAPGVATDFPFAYYLVAVRNKIGANWIQPGVDRRTRTTLFFRIARDGSVKDVRIEAPSGIPLFDQAAQRAVLASSPLPPLPQAFSRDELGVHFDFEVTH